MLRPAILLVLAALATPTAPPAGASPWCAEGTVLDGGPPQWPGSHLRVGWSRALDAAEADVTGAGPGTPAPPSVRARVPREERHAAVGSAEHARASAAFHLRDRASHPATAPPQRA